jgi:glutamine---fructose-6-phosphate transaminase (isomerizing)
MCGIIGFLSPADPAPAPGDEIFGAVEALGSWWPNVSGPLNLSGAERDELGARLSAAHEAAYRWMLPSGFIAAVGDAKIQARIREEAARLESWAAALDTAAAGAHRQTHDTELLGLLAGGARDIAWQLEHDLLGGIDPALDLCRASSDDDPQVLGHAWQLNFLLAAVNRLEVRGRDSAGLAIYLRFPSAGALDAFLCGPGDTGARERELAARLGGAALPHLALLRPATAHGTLLAVFKVASEVGHMGDNVAAIRRAITGDDLFQAALREPGVRLQALGHTRWASNGVISVPNCHPVDSAVITPGGIEGAGEILAVLNGDVDNYRSLVEKFVAAGGDRIDPSVTTDAKIIPLVVAHFRRQTGDLGQAVRAAADLFEGSMAIGIMAADHPGELYFAQKGSGQGLFFGLSDEGVVMASEMYGVVQLTPDYAKAEGERTERGESFRLRAGAEAVGVEIDEGPGWTPLPANRSRRAQITTRDINRGDSPHFLLKEIRESPDSVRKTLRGRFDASGGTVRFSVGDALAESVVAAIRSGTIRRILPIGQGTAAVAAEGLAHMLLAALAPRHGGPALEIAAIKGTELSGNHLAGDMSDTLIVAISQSGTTTDTNRTVDMARARGAKIVSIVNRRDSDLVYKSDGVLFTSDGRDVEMSVASTKAYYSQNAAGQILALALADALGTLPPEAILAGARDLEALPDALERTLRLEGEIADLARRFALSRSHWAVVGSGASKIAADEIRIKLSELCYKSIAIDHLEDKKHIDLSSEPLILVCAHGLPEETITDAVKEVAIFRAHNSIPIVITDEGEDRFDPYAAGVVKLPPYRGRLSYLLGAMAGHLFGYHAAVSFDSYADRARRIRAGLQESLLARGGAELTPTSEALPPALTDQVLELERSLTAGEVDGGLTVGTATRLSRALGVLLGRFPVDVFSRMHGNWFDGVVACLSQAVTELSRPIDAIKHQAKTVTVGISRPEPAAAEGPLWAAFRALKLDAADVAESHRRLLTAMEPLVASVDGTTLYQVSGLNRVGKPTNISTIRVVTKTGSAAAIESRNEGERFLAGTKWGVARRGEVYVGYGQTDGRKVMILPVIGERSEGHLLLYHLSLADNGDRAVRRRALEARPEHLDRLRVAVTERNVAWSPDLIDRVDNDTLFFETIDRLAEAICRAPASDG